MTTPAERTRESGSALIVVLVALLVLTPLAVLISTLSLSYQRHTTSFRDGLRSRFAVRGGLDMALGRLQASEPPRPSAPSSASSSATRERCPWPCA